MTNRIITTPADRFHSGQRDLVASIPPIGSIISWIGGSFSTSSNTSFALRIGTANTIAAVNTLVGPNWKVCDGAAVTDLESPIFYDGRRLPNLTDDRFLKGDTLAGTPGGSNTMLNHTHTHSLTAAGQTLSASVDTGDAGSHSHGGSTGSAGAHSHLYSGYRNVASGGISVKSREKIPTDPFNDYAGDAAGNHQHSISSAGNHRHTMAHAHAASSVSGSVGAGVTAATTSNIPLFLSVFYLIRIK